MLLTAPVGPTALDPQIEGRSLDLVISQVGETLVAVDLDRVREIADRETPAAEPPGADDRLDLAALWGLPTGGAVTRHVIVVTTERGPRWLILGPAVRVEAVPATAVQPTPPFLAGLIAAAGIRAILVDERIGFLVDVDRLAKIRDGGGDHE